MEFMGNKVDFLGIAPSKEEDMLRMIEVAGRTCYKSEEKIGPLTYHTFFKMILNRKHFSVIEHSNTVLRIRKDQWENFYPEMVTWLHISKQGGYFELAEFDGYYYIAANLRAWFMFYVKLFHLMKGNVNSSPILSFVLYSLLNHYPKIFKMFVDSIEDYVPIEVDENVPWFGSYMELVNEELQVEILIKSNLRMNLPVFIFRVLTNRGITHELCRNRTCGFSQESTRYVNYYKKLGLRFFNDSKRFPEPSEVFDENFILEAKEKVFNLYKDIEDTYNHLVEEVDGKRLMHQEFARNILPNSLMAEIIISSRLGADDEYSGYDLSTQFTHLIRQRTSSAAHPDIRPIGAAIFKYIDMIINKEKYVEVKEEEVEKDYLNNWVKEEK